MALRLLFCLLLSGRLRQVLLYICIMFVMSIYELCLEKIHFWCKQTTKIHISLCSYTALVLLNDIRGCIYRILNFKILASRYSPACWLESYQDRFSHDEACMMLVARFNI